MDHSLKIDPKEENIDPLDYDNPTILLKTEYSIVKNFFP